MEFIKKILKVFGLYPLVVKVAERYYARLEEKIIRNKKLNNYSLMKDDFENFKMLESRSKKRFELNKDDIYPFIHDKDNNHEFDPHYTYHPSWAIRIIKNINPEVHYDISSILNFSCLLSAFIPVKFFDYRVAKIKLPNITCGSADLLSLPFDNDSIKSLSCMHVVEHIGLGRYGDNLDYDGDVKAINELKRVLAPDGDLLFVVPVGKPKIFFNAHRIYSYEQIIKCFSDFKLVEFSLIPDNAVETGIIYNASKALSDEQDYGCGCFWFKK